MLITNLINDGIRKIISLSHEQTLPILKDDSSAEETTSFTASPSQPGVIFNASGCLYNKQGGCHASQKIKGISK